ncbi:hypothetical protein D3C83_143870 [compost metagenome]
MIVNPRLRQLRDATMQLSSGSFENSRMRPKRFFVGTSAVMGSTPMPLDLRCCTIAPTITRRPEKTIVFSPRSAARRTYVST